MRTTRLLAALVLLVLLLLSLRASPADRKVTVIDLGGMLPTRTCYAKEGPNRQFVEHVVVPQDATFVYFDCNTLFKD